MITFKPCVIKNLPKKLQIQAAEEAIRVNPANAPIFTLIGTTSLELEPLHLALLTGKYWGSEGIKLTVSFLDNPSGKVRRKILEMANSWGEFGNVKFTETSTDGQIRIARTPRSGYWSYLGTDILQIPKNKPTMNLDSFSDSTPDSEYVRVVKHEVGHCLGFPHEHARREIVSKIDPNKAIAYFGRTQGWNSQVVRQQVLTPLEESSLLGTENADEDSIMCYQLPGSITFDGQPIRGGYDIGTNDKLFAGKIYPLSITPPPVDVGLMNISIDIKAKVMGIKLPEGWSVVSG